MPSLAQPSPAAPSTPRRIHGLGLIGLGAVFSITLTTPVTSLYLGRVGLSTVHIGGVIGAMSLALIVSEVLALGASSWIGRRLSVLASLGGSAVMFTCFPLAGSLVALYATRLVLGAARGLLWPVLFAEVAEAGSSARATALFALFWLYFGVGQLLGPTVGGWLGQQVSLTAPFFGAAVASLATAVAVGAVRPVRDISPNPLPSYAALFQQSPSVWRAWLLIVCNTVVFGVYTTFLPLYAVGRGRTPEEVGLVFTGGGVAFIITQVILHRMPLKVSPVRLLILSFLARGVGVSITPWLASFWGLFIVNFFTSILGAAVPPALSTRITDRAPRDNLVAAMGGLNAAADLGFFVGPVVGGVLAGRGVQWAFGLVPAVTLLAVTLLVADPDRSRAESPLSFVTPEGDGRPPSQ
jgi:MFS family permease